MTALRFARLVVECVLELVTGRLNGDTFTKHCQCPACTPAKAELLEKQLLAERVEADASRRRSHLEIVR